MFFYRREDAGTSAERATGDARRVVQELYGTPDDPSWPLPDNNLADLAESGAISGPVSSEKDGTHLGLFREHCVVCHALGERSGVRVFFRIPTHGISDTAFSSGNPPSGERSQPVMTYARFS